MPMKLVPLDGLLLLLHHVRQLLEDGAQLHNGGFNVLHGVRPALDIRILQRQRGVSAWGSPHPPHPVSGIVLPISPTSTCSSINCSCWLVRLSMSMATSPARRGSSCSIAEPPAERCQCSQGCLRLGSPAAEPQASVLQAPREGRASPASTQGVTYWSPFPRR